MKRLSLLLAVLLLAGCAQVNRVNRYGTGHDDSNTVNALPVAGTSNFASSAILFLKQEDANRWLEQKFPNFVSSGCVGMTSPGLILTPTACIAYNAGFRSTETGAITLNDNSSTWVAMDENTSGSNAGLLNFTRAGSTHYLLDTLDVSQPTMPNDAQLIARVTTLGGAITAIDQSMKKTTPQTTGPAGAAGPAGSTGLTGATGAAGPAGPAPTGNIPQLVGYSGANVVEAETVTGDCTYTRTGLNAYSMTCAKVNTNPVAATAPTNAQVWVENAGATSMVPVSISGDCTMTAAGAFACTKTSGTAFGTLATLGVGTSLSSGGGNLNLNMPGGTCTNQFGTALSATGTLTCSTDTLASAQHANQGTTTTVLHGNAAGNPSFGAVSLTADVSGVLPAANGGFGTLSPTLFKTNTVVDVLNTVTPTTVCSFAVPGNTMGANGVLRMTVIGDLVVNTASTKTITFTTAFGGVNYNNASVITNGNSANLNTFDITAYIANENATNVQYGRVKVEQNAGQAAGTMGNLSSGFQQTSYNTGAADTTGSQTISFSVTLGTSTATIDYKMRSCIIELL